jgi:serine/threonine protein kinase
MLQYHGEFVIPKYIDFGLSKVLLQGQVDKDRFGTLAFCSPEILLG